MRILQIIVQGRSLGACAVGADGTSMPVAVVCQNETTTVLIARTVTSAFALPSPQIKQIYSRIRIIIQVYEKVHNHPFDAFVLHHRNGAGTIH